MKHFLAVLLKIMILVSMLAYFSNCTFDNEEDLLEGFTCDTIDIVYSDLTYIFTDICLDCHESGDTYRPGIEMDDYEEVKASINTGLVFPAIKHEGQYNMPYEQPKLPDCDIKKIEAWINAGMPED